MATVSVLKSERLRSAHTLALKEATNPYNHELMDDEERLLLLDRIRRLRKSPASCLRRLSRACRYTTISVRRTRGPL